MLVNVNIFFCNNEFTFYKQQILIACLRLKIYGINTVSNGVKMNGMGKD